MLCDVWKVLLYSFTGKMRCECFRRPNFLWLAPSPALAKAFDAKRLTLRNAAEVAAPLCMQSTYPIFGRAALK